MRIAVATLLVAGCSFVHGAAADQPDGRGSGDPDSTTVTARTCKFPRSDLRLCTEFDDGVLGPVVHDSSMFRLDLPASDINQWSRSGMPAAGLVFSSDLRVPETQSLDISSAITLEMWVEPAWNQTVPLLYNDRQYGLWLDGDGRITCTIAGVSVTSDSEATATTWSHVACVYDGAALYVVVNNGSASAVRCISASAAIPIDGASGTLIAPNYVGAIDDVRIYAGALSGTEICRHADKSCALSCTPSG